MANSKTQLFTTPIVTCRYPKLIEPNGDDAKYDAAKFTLTVFIPKSDKDLVEKIQSAIKDAAGNIKNWHNPLRDGDEKIDEETGDPKKGYEGMYFFTAKTGSAYPPRVFDARNNQLNDPELVDMLSWFEGRVAVNFKKYESGMGKGVTAYLSQVQIVKPGERRAAASAFDAFEEDYEI